MIAFKGCSASDALVAGDVYRVTFIQTTAQQVGAIVFSSFSPSTEFLAVYQRISDEGKSPYSYPVSQPPALGGDAMVVDVKIRSQEFHSGTVADLANSLDDLDSYVSVSAVEKPSRQALGSAGRGSAIDTATAAGAKQAQDTGFFAGLEKALGSLRTVLIVAGVATVAVVGYLAARTYLPSRK